MDRRGFLASCLVACAAPAIVRADSLMKIVPIETTFLRPGFMAMTDLNAGPLTITECYGRIIMRDGKVYIEDSLERTFEQNATGAWLYPGMGKTRFDQVTPRS